MASLLCILEAPAQQRGRRPKLPPEESQVQQWMAAMSLRDKIAQLIVIPFYGENPHSKSAAFRKFSTAVSELHVGGMILVNRVRQGLAINAEPVTAAAFLNRMQKLAKVPLIAGADFERGASMRVSGTTKFPHNMAFAAARDLAATRKLGEVTARESRAMGVHWVFAPVADVNNNPGNPIISIRAFSENAAEVSAHVKAFLEGAQAEGRKDTRHRVLVTVKHFPGHGDTVSDSHLGLGKVEAALERLRAVELPPFQAAIDAKVDSIMTAHLWVPAIEPEEIPATVSAKVLTGLLRKEMRFTGIITTDAMDMQGLSRQFSHGEAAVRSLEAGADVLLMPPDPAAAVSGVARAVQSGRLSLQRVEESVQKILRAKVRLGLHKSRVVDLESVSDSLELEEDEELAQRVATRAVALVRNEGGVLPLAKPETSCWYLLTENRLGQQGRALAEFLTDRSPKAKRILLDPQVSRTVMESSVDANCSVHIAAAFAGFSGKGVLSANYAALVEALAAGGKPVVLVGLGNPYLLRGYEKVQAFLATFSTVPASEIAAAKAILGDIAVSGKMPVTIPGLAPYGSGLETARK